MTQPPHPPLQWSDEVKEAIEHLKTSSAALEGQLTNPAAWLHHVIESVEAVETDIKWLKAMLTTFGTT